MTDIAMPGYQLALDLPITASFAADDFLVAPTNATAHGLIMAWPAWPDPMLMLVGPQGAGKSHLGAIWAERACATICHASAITHEDVPGLADRPALLIEDADRAPRDEAALFHLVNLLRARGGSCLWTATTPPDGWGIVTRDLLSRLRLAPVAELMPPEEALLKAVLVKLFADRQVKVDATVIDALALRLPRSVAAARAMVETLDRAALAGGRRITRAMALDYVQRGQPEAHEP